ncbi:hypothetical protein CC78DRAFT_586300 [Lojkania enalia]|uniref:Uncharacterized protein n=1 Tax=Lojkania enalia TaxID=147567 RepID=A0A9P4K1S0_9PLEO|nr:hypothetical protein CC78DRAFT_586300 [Didymosphaeria enalia]
MSRVPSKACPPLPVPNHRISKGGTQAGAWVCLPLSPPQPPANQGHSPEALAFKVLIMIGYAVVVFPVIANYFYSTKRRTLELRHVGANPFGPAGSTLSDQAISPASAHGTYPGGTAQRRNWVYLCHTYNRCSVLSFGESWEERTGIFEI